MKRRVLCPYCDRRRLRNAIRLFQANVDRGEFSLREEIVLGCRSCLAKAAWFHGLSFTNLLNASEYRTSTWDLFTAFCIDIGWVLGAFVRGKTKWLRAALDDAGVTYREFLTGFEDRGPRTPASRSEQIDVARSLVTVLRTVAGSLPPGTPHPWTSLRGHIRFLLDAEPEIFARVDPGETPLNPPSVAEVLDACDILRERMDPQNRTLALHMMLELISSEATARPEAIARILDIALECGIDPDAADRLLGVQTKTKTKTEPEPEPDHPFDQIAGSEDPRVILGVAEDASAAEIRRRYLALVHEHHPDRHAHLGRAFEDAATRRLKIINEAYRKIDASKARRPG